MRISKTLSFNRPLSYLEMQNHINDELKKIYEHIRKREKMDMEEEEKWKQKMNTLKNVA